MKKSKKDEGEPSPDVIRILGRCFLAAMGVFLVWGLMYNPLKASMNRMHLPTHLAWMLHQRNLAQFIVPDNNTLLLSPGISSNKSLTVLVVVCSAVPNFQARLAIRNTWAKDSISLTNSRVLFLLGTSQNKSINAKIVQESQNYGDIIQQDFLDTYNNLTIKSVMLLKWVIQSSVNTSFIMKTDDDMFVHLPNLLKFLGKRTLSKRLLVGCLITGATPIKDWHSKWFVPNVIFPERSYPPYLSGTGYVMSKDLVYPLYKTALHTPFFYLEDIFITGICSRRAGIKPENSNGFKFYKRKNDICIFKSLITAHKMNVKEMYLMWKKVHTPSPKCKS